jgi:tryptophan-rich sensory protein
MHTAADNARPFRWLIWFVLTVAAAMAIWDTVSGSARDAVASCAYLALLVIEVTWWPTRQEQLLTNADRAVQLADQTETSD